MSEELNKNTNEGQEATETQTPKTYTQEEVNELLQKEADRRVSEALKKAEKKSAEKIKEAQKLATLNEQQKYEYELEQREKAIAEKERELALSENKTVASKILSERGISLELVDFVVAEDADTMNNNINLLDKAFKASVKAEVEKRLNTTTPKANLPTNVSYTKKDFATMPLSQMQELYKNNPELFK